MKKNLIAIALADLHINNWKPVNDYKNDRLLQCLRTLDIVGQRAKQLNVPILFPGDLFHKPKALDNDVIEEFINYYRLYIEDLGNTFIAISGNHDQSKKNTYDYKSPSYVKAFSNVFKSLKCIDGSIYTQKEFVVCGIPYLTFNKGLSRYMEFFKQQLKAESRFKILLIHSDIPGATNNSGYELKESKRIPTNINKFFSDFDLVLAGHIHKPQQLGNKVFMLGSP